MRNKALWWRSVYDWQGKSLWWSGIHNRKQYVEQNLKVYSFISYQRSMRLVLYDSVFLGKTSQMVSCKYSTPIIRAIWNNLFQISKFSYTGNANSKTFSLPAKQWRNQIKHVQQMLPCCCTASCVFHIIHGNSLGWACPRCSTFQDCMTSNFKMFVYLLLSGATFLNVNWRAIPSFNQHFNTSHILFIFCPENISVSTFETETTHLLGFTVKVYLVGQLLPSWNLASARALQVSKIDKGYLQAIY